MNREEKLKKLFSAIAFGSLAVGGAGCADEFDEILCEEGETFDSTLALMEGSGAEYFEKITETWTTPHTGEDTDHAVLTSRETFGEPCAGASDKPTCLEAFEALPDEGGIESAHYNPLFGGSFHERHRYFYTRGDTVGAITTEEEVDQFPIPIDDAKAAAALITISKETKRYGRPDCGVPAARFMPEGIVVRVREPMGCTEYYIEKEHLILVRPEGGLEHLEERVLDVTFQGCVVGRLTDGVRIALDPSKLSVADHLAEMAALEAAAVHAFRRLAEEMRSLGAPESMIERAYDAADDEVRHAVMVGLEAKRRGKTPRAIEVGPMPIREALEIALENAREGMVRETYGALAAHYHALAATDPRLARLFERLAEDETRHAALSLEFGEFLEAKLSDEERRLVDEARHESLRQLDEELKVALADEVHDELGWPRPDAARSMLHEAFPAIWSQVG